MCIISLFRARRDVASLSFVLSLSLCLSGLFISDDPFTHRGRHALRWFGLSMCFATPSRGGQARQYEALEPSAPDAHESSGADPLFSSPLTRAQLTQRVLSVHPSLSRLSHLRAASSARVTQTDALDDPTLSYQSSPLTLGSQDGYRQVITLSQRLPWPGRLGLKTRAREVDVKVHSAQLDLGKRRLIERASTLFHELYLSRKALELNEAHQRWMTRALKSAQGRYAHGLGDPTEPLSAQIVLSELGQKRVALRTRRALTIARINRTLHRPPDASLPPPPPALSVPERPRETLDALIVKARTRHPMMTQQRALLEKMETQRALSDLAFAPDITVSGSYNSMWTHTDHRVMIGLSLQLPISIDRRRAQQAEAMAHVAQTAATSDLISDEIDEGIYLYYTRLSGAIERFQLLKSQTLPLLKQRSQASEDRYSTGEGSMRALIQAIRSLIEAQWRVEALLIEAWQARDRLAFYVDDPLTAPTIRADHRGGLHVSR
jgi:outer membrane protein, heavy metal efflux system